MTLLLTLLAAAHAQDGLSTDVELVRPTFAAGSLPWVDSPRMMKSGAWRVGVLTQYERDPLVLYRFGNEAGGVISHRESAQLGLDYDFARRFSVRLLLPVIAQWGSDVPDLDADGLGLGDTWLGFRMGVWSSRRVTTGFRADVALPVGSKDSYMGEEQVRGSGGLLAMATFGPVDVLGDLGLTGRSALDTGNDWILESEVGASIGFRYHLWPELLALTGGALYRSGVTHLFEGGAENSAEALAGVQVLLTPELQLDLGVGKGLLDGYGTTEFRGMAGLTWTRAPAPEPPPVELPPPVTVVEVEEPEPPPPPPPPEPEWEEGEIAKVVERKIEIRDPIQFEFNKDIILPESLPILDAVARILNEELPTAWVIVEGHASEEGSYEYNYKLSNLRAKAVYEALIRAGVHPSRISYRGMGEVVPIYTGQDEASLALNRRVEFHLIRDPLDGEVPQWDPDILLPWNGQPYTVQPPPPPEATHLLHQQGAEGQDEEPAGDEDYFDPYGSDEEDEP